MGIIATDAGGSDFEQVPTGTHNAICYKLVDAGTSLNEYQGEISKKHNVFIFWELPELRMADDRPMSINCQYTLSLNKLSKLRQHLQAWRNKSFTEEELNSFDLTKILGTTCKVDVGLTSGGNAKVQGVFCAAGGAKKVATVRWSSTLRITATSSPASLVRRARLRAISSRVCLALCSGRLAGAKIPARTRLSHASSFRLR